MKRNGFTIVELMVVVAIVGALAAVVIPQFAAHAGQAKTVDARAELQVIANQAVRYFQEHRTFPDGASAVLPGPDGAACGETGKLFPHTDEWATDPVWSKLEFSVDSPSRFSFHFRSTGPKSARAWAVADLQCNGNRVEYEIVLEARRSGEVEWVMIDPFSRTKPTLPTPEGMSEEDEEDEPETTGSGTLAGTAAADAYSALTGYSGTGSTATTVVTGGSSSTSSGDSGTGTSSGTGTTSGTSGSGTTTGNGSSSGGGNGGGGGGGSGGSSTSSDSGSSGSGTSGSGTGGSSSTSGGGSSSTSGGGSSSTSSGGSSSTSGGSSSGGSSSSGATSGGSTSGGSSSGGGSSSCSSGGTTVIVCPSGYELHLATCSCKKSN